MPQRVIRNFAKKKAGSALAACRERCRPHLILSIYITNLFHSATKIKNILPDIRQYYCRTSVNLLSYCMDPDFALRRYREGAFSDDDVTANTGLTLRAWRELIKNRAVRTITARRGPGRVRLCDATVFKRAAVIAALNRAGFSLAVSGQIAYFHPYHTLLYAICDPATIFFSARETLISKPGSLDELNIRKSIGSIRPSPPEPTQKLTGSLRLRQTIRRGRL